MATLKLAWLQYMSVFLFVWVIGREGLLFLFRFRILSSTKSRWPVIIILLYCHPNHSHSHPGLDQILVGGSSRYSSLSYSWLCLFSYSNALHLLRILLHHRVPGRDLKAHPAIGDEEEENPWSDSCIHYRSVDVENTISLEGRGLPKPPHCCRNTLYTL